MEIKSLQDNPFQLFFPLGALVGIAGVGLWVVWSVGWRIQGIAMMHAFLQSQGFLSLFVLGFLMTAFPRFLGAPSVEIKEITGALVGEGLLFWGVFSRHWMCAEAGFLLSLLVLIIFAARRFPQRTKPLPPSFILMGFGWLHAAGGTILIMATHMGTVSYAPFSMGRQMIQLGFLLCLVLGISGKLAPFLLGYANNPELELSLPNRRWPTFYSVFPHGVVGVGLLASFMLEPWFPRPAAFLRAGLATFHLIRYARISRLLRKRTTTSGFFYVSLWMVPLGLWLAAIFPAFRIAALHVVFIGGFSLMIFSFGMLVVLSHSAQAALLATRIKPLWATGLCVFLALILRGAAELWPSSYRPMIHSASGFWVLGALIWGGAVILKLKRSAPPGV